MELEKLKKKRKIARMFSDSMLIICTVAVFDGGIIAHFNLKDGAIIILAGAITFVLAEIGSCIENSYTRELKSRRKHFKYEKENVA